MTTSTWQVTGMTCGHCVSAVRSEIEALDGVSSADVTLESGAVVVESARDLPRDEVAAAVAEAGYELV